MFKLHISRGSSVSTQNCSGSVAEASSLRWMAMEPFLSLQIQESEAWSGGRTPQALLLCPLQERRLLWTWVCQVDLYNGGRSSSFSDSRLNKSPVSNLLCQTSFETNFVCLKVFLLGTSNCSGLYRAEGVETAYILLCELKAENRSHKSQLWECQAGSGCNH